ncbi:MAG: GrpB family protein [Roseibacillus sp.]
MPSRYRFAEYSAEWPRESEQEAKRWRELLGAELIEVHHIRRTSVPGLAAKPIIDVLPLVREGVLLRAH